MLATRKLVAIGAVLAVTVSGIALAETMPDHHQTGPDHQQMEQGQHPMGPGHMQEMMRQHQSMMPMGGHAGMHADMPYAGQQARPIKALSDDDVAALRNGEGMGMAKAAELNGYPGPKHVLDFSATTATQRRTAARRTGDL